VGVVSVCLSAPARPTLSPTFHAQVSVSLREGTKNYRGGGIYAYDIKNNRARTDYRLEDESQHEKYKIIHVLERYDLHAAYVIDGDDKCTKSSVTGNLPNPWEWISKATFSGTGTFRSEPYDEWQYDEKASNITQRIAVLTKDPSKPVFYNIHEINKGVISQTDLVFEEFDTNEPAAWVFYVPKACDNGTRATSGGDVNAVVYFANNNWNCATVSCSSRVPAGTGQPSYQCAEFAARSLAAGGYIPGLSSTAAQSAYGNYRGYNLLLVTGLHSALEALGFKAAGTVEAAYALFGDGGEGAWSHACIGVGANTVDCHNNARQGLTAAGVMYKGINAISAHP